MCLPVPTKDSPFIDRKIETEEQPPPVPLSPRPNTQCSLSSNLVTVCGKVGEVCVLHHFCCLFLQQLISCLC